MVGFTCAVATCTYESWTRALKMLGRNTVSLLRLILFLHSKQMHEYCYLRQNRKTDNNDMTSDMN